jgi:hypothetical protein
VKPINKAMWLELVGGIFGWIWIAACIGVIYFLIQAVFYDGGWVNLVGVMLAGGISKTVLREYETRKNSLMTQESINDDGNKKSDDSGEPAWVEEAEKVIQKYGEVLEHFGLAGGCVADEGKLPYPKDVIKTALIKALQNTADGHQKNHLKIAYLNLANWQSDVGDSNQGIDVSQFDPMIDPTELVALLKSSQAWSQMVLDEEIELQAELKELGL